MSASAVQNKTVEWILGESSPRTLKRLWERYLTDLNAPSPAKFAQLRLQALGVDVQLATALPPQRPTVLTDPHILESVEAALRDDNGRSLQKLLLQDAKSRVLVEAAQVFSSADSLAKEALQLLSEISPVHAVLLNSMIQWIVPIYHEKFERPFRRGFSHANHLGVIFTSFVERLQQPTELRRTVLAIDLAHEVGHQALILYQLSDPIMATSLDAPVYSSVRRTHRPAIMTLHACVAAAYMMDVCEAVLNAAQTKEIEKRFAQNSLAELRENQRLSLAGLREASRFTEIGERIMTELEAQMVRVSSVNISALHQKEEKLSYFGLLLP